MDVSGEATLELIIDRLRVAVSDLVHGPRSELAVLGVEGCIAALAGRQQILKTEIERIVSAAETTIKLLREQDVSLVTYMIDHSPLAAEVVRLRKAIDADNILASEAL